MDAAHPVLDTVIEVRMASLQCRPTQKAAHARPELRAFIQRCLATNGSDAAMCCGEFDRDIRHDSASPAQDLLTP
jgi:hypothetical protein